MNLNIFLANRGVYDSFHRNVKKTDYKIDRISTNTKRRKAQLGNIILFECSVCRDFKTPDLYNINKKQPFGIHNMCKRCYNKRQKDKNKAYDYENKGEVVNSLSQIRHFKKQNNFINFEIKECENGYKVVYSVGDTFSYQDAPTKIVPMMFQARQLINKDLARKVSICEGIEYDETDFSRKR